MSAVNQKQNSNSVDQDDMARSELSHMNLHCLHRCLLCPAKCHICGARLIILIVAEPESYIFVTFSDSCFSKRPRHDLNKKD